MNMKRKSGTIKVAIGFNFTRKPSKVELGSVKRLLKTLDKIIGPDSEGLLDTAAEQAENLSKLAEDLDWDREAQEYLIASDAETLVTSALSQLLIAYRLLAKRYGLQE